MFIVADVIKEKKSLSNLLFKKSTPNCQLDYIAVNGGAPFMHLKIKEIKAEIDWEEVKFRTGLCSKYLLINETVKLPENIGVGRYVPILLPMMCIFNNMKTILSSLENKNVEVVIYDDIGVFAHKIEELFTVVQSVFVVTKNECYDNIQQELLKSIGASLIVSRSTLDLKNKIAISPIYTKAMKNALAVFSLKSDCDYPNLIYGTHIPIEEKHSKSKPDCIDDDVFASALYEFSAIHSLSNRSYENLYLGQQKCSEEDIIHHIMTNAPSAD